MSYLLSNNATFPSPQSYAPAAFEYPSNGNSSWDSYVASHTNSLGDASNMGGYDYDDYGLMPPVDGMAHMNASAHYGKRAYTKKKRASSKGKKAKSPAKAKKALAGAARAVATVAKDVKVAKKALSPRKSSPKKKRVLPKFMKKASPKRSPSPAKRHHRKSKSPKRVVATKKRPGHFGLRGKGGYNRQMAAIARQESALKHFTPSALKLYSRAKKLRVHKGPQGYRHMSHNQAMYRELVKELRPQGLTMKQIGARWRQMRGGHQQPGLRAYYAKMAKAL